ncbi:MAG: TonB family protein [Porticoccaceae bacterium]
MMNKVQARQSGFLLLAPSAIIAIVVVFGLLFLMQFLIQQELPEPEESGPRIADVWQEQREIEDQVRERKIEEIDEPEQPPPDIPKQDIDVEASMDSLDLSATRVQANVDISLGGGFSDGDIIPLVAIQPDYPRRALERGIEGYVVVSFTITTQGTTRDVQVIESTSSIFDRSAVRAAERLKYKPRIIDGNPVEVDHFYKFTFELAE